MRKRDAVFLAFLPSHWTVSLLYVEADKLTGYKFTFALHRCCQVLCPFEYSRRNFFADMNRMELS